MLLFKKNKPRGEKSPRRCYHHTNKSNVAKTLIFRVAAAESPATQRSRSQPAAPREQRAHPGLPLSEKRHQQPKPQADGEHQITRMIGYFESKLPYQPSLRPRVATPLPAPASTGTSRSLGGEREEEKNLPSLQPLKKLSMHPPRGICPTAFPWLLHLSALFGHQCLERDIESLILPTEYIQKTLGLFRKQLAAVQRKMVFSNG